MPNLNTSYVKVKQWQQIYNKLKMLDLNTSYVEVKPVEIENEDEIPRFKYILC